MRTEAIVFRTDPLHLSVGQTIILHIDDEKNYNENMTIKKIIMRKLHYVISKDDSCAESSVGNEVGWAELLSGSMTTNADIRFNHKTVSSSSASS